MKTKWIVTTALVVLGTIILVNKVSFLRSLAYGQPILQGPRKADGTL